MNSYFAHCQSVFLQYEETVDSCPDTQYQHSVYHHQFNVHCKEFVPNPPSSSTSSLPSPSFPSIPHSNTPFVPDFVEFVPGRACHGSSSPSGPAYEEFVPGSAYHPSSSIPNPTAAPLPVPKYHEFVPGSKRHASSSLPIDSTNYGSSSDDDCPPITCSSVKPAPVPNFAEFFPGRDYHGSAPSSGYGSSSEDDCPSIDEAPLKKARVDNFRTRNHRFGKNSWTRDMDLDKMTTKNNGWMTHSYYLDEMDKLISENVKEKNYPKDDAILNLNRDRNEFLDKDVLDLHRLQCNLAERVLKARIDEIKAGRRPRELWVCAGQGKHSEGGFSRLHGLVRWFAGAQGAKCRAMEGNKGVLILTFP